MRAFIAAKIGLLPFVLFWALAPAAPPRAAGLALILSLALNLWRWRSRAVKQMELAGLALFVLLVFIPGPSAAVALALSFFVLALAAFVSLARQKPWTADYSATAYGELRESPVFTGVNKALSSLWMALFALLGILQLSAAPPVFSACVVAFGALASIFGPNILVRAILSRKLAARQKFDWPAPVFDRRDGELDVAVIGAGIGGLAAAGLLARAGLNVRIFEQHVLPGGYCHSWLRKAHDGDRPLLFRFDAGPHDFSGAWPGGTLDKLLHRLDCADKVDWLRLDYRFIDSRGKIFDAPRDGREHAARLAARFPEDAEGVQELFRIMKALFDALTPSTGEDFAGPPQSVKAMLAFARENPLFPIWADRPFVDLLRQKLKTASAREALSTMVGYISDDPRAPSCADMAPIFGYYFNGGFYPRGGTSVFAEALAEAFRAHGGEIAFKTPVREIWVEQGRAVGLILANGEKIRARAVVANSDPRKTFLEMIDAADLPADFRRKFTESPPATSGFAVHLGVRGEGEGPPLTFIAGNPSCLVARPGLIDTSEAPEHYSTVDIFSLFPHETAKDWLPPEGADWRAWRKTEAYLRRKRDFAEKLIDRAETAFPGLRARIVYRCEASPLTYARYDRASAGAIYGIAPAGRLSGSKTPLVNLAVAGAINLGPGVEAAALSGVWAAEALCPGCSREKRTRAKF